MYNFIANSSAKTNRNNKNGLFSKQKENSGNGMLYSILLKLFEDMLKDIYWTEKTLTKAIPKMIKSATSKELIDTLTYHCAETLLQVTRVEKVFESLGKKAVSKKCKDIDGLMKVALEKMKSMYPGDKCDEGIMITVRKVEYFEIESYETLCQMAETLGLDDAVGLLQITLYEEMEAHEKLSEIALSAVIARISIEEEEVRIAYKQNDNLLYA